MNRRDFIKTGSGAFFIASAGRAFGAAAPSSRVRLAIVGCHAKGRGASVMRSAMKVPGVEIAWVCDVDSRALDFAAAEVEKLSGFKPRKEKDLRKVLEDKELDGIISVTPDHWHACSAVLAMRAGKAVFVEKPCCFCPSEGEILIDVWNSTGAVFQMGNQRRASLAYREAIEYVRTSGVIGAMKWAKCWYMSNRASIGRGKPAAVPEWLDWDLWQGPAPRCEYRDNLVHYNWHWFRHWGTAETGNNAPHFADAARWALDVGHPSSVQCSAGLFFRREGDDYEWPDTFNASFKYPGEKFVTFELASHCNQKPPMNVGTGALVYGEKGVLFLDPRDRAELFDVKGVKIKEWKSGGSTRTGSLTDPTNSLDCRHMAKYVECIRTRDRNTNSPADEAVKSTMMPLMMNISAEMGEEIRFDAKTGKPITKIPERLWSREYAKGWELV